MAYMPLEVISSPIFGESTQAEPVADGNFGFVKPEHAVFPPILVIAVTNVCDMACIHCAHQYGRKHGMLRFDETEITVGDQSLLVDFCPFSRLAGIFLAGVVFA